VISRRALLKGLGAFVAGGVSLSGYAFGVEPFRLVETRYRVTPPGWPEGLQLKLAVLADIHACEPWMSAGHVWSIVARTNALKPDATLLLGDYVVAHKWISGRVPAPEWAQALGELRAPLGVHGVLGNHDWWDDKVAQRRGYGPTASGTALEAVGVRVYENDAIRLEKSGQAFWLAGLGDQFALLNRGTKGLYSKGVDDLAGTLRKVTDDAPIVLMAHEPDIFPRVPPRVALTIAGHTHGGQIRVLGRPAFQTYGREPYSYGHFVERSTRRFGDGERNLIVSGGLGCSVLPVRFGVVPEIVIVELGA
jgi:uncharacterized protein